MTAPRVELIGFEEDDALDDVFRGFGLIADYRSFLPDHLTEILRRQHPNVELRSLELLETPKCDVGGMPSPDNEEHVIVDTMKVPLELRIRLSTTGSDLHELYATLVIRAEDVQAEPRITSDMFVRDHSAIS